MGVDVIQLDDEAGGPKQTALTIRRRKSRLWKSSWFQLLAI